VGTPQWNAYRQLIVFAVVAGTFAGTASGRRPAWSYAPVGIDHLGLAYAARPMASGLVMLVIWNGTQVFA
jgi:hypothetical protein